MVRIVVVAAALWALAAPAAAQVPGGPTTTTGGPTTTTLQSTTTTLPSTTTTGAPIVPASPDDPAFQPPAAILASPAGEVRARTGSYCWTSPTQTVVTQKLCAYAPFPDPSTLPLLKVPGDATVTLRFDTSASPTETKLTAISAAGDRHSLNVDAANPTSFAANLSPGTYVLDLFTLWERGDAGYYVRLQVEPQSSPATPLTSTGTRRLPATGRDLDTLAGAGVVIISMGAIMLLARRHRA